MKNVLIAIGATIAVWDRELKQIVPQGEPTATVNVDGK